MKFIIDAQLPRKFIFWLNEAGHNAIHTSDLPDKNLTSDKEITALAVLQNRVVVTKDADFAQAFLINGEPLLLLISTGNISNTELETIIKTNLGKIVEAFISNRFIELTRDSLITHI